MKTKLTLLTLLAILFALQAKAQVPYTPFDFESSIWSEHDYSNWFVQRFYDVVMDGDTTINNQNYQKLRQQGIAYSYDMPDVISDSSVIDYYVGAIRENDMKQVFYIPDGQMDDNLLYDFNFSIGDTIDIMDYGVSPYPAKVVSSDTVEICGVLRNRYHLEFIEVILYVPYLIEGVGLTAGVIPGLELFESGTFSDCYSADNCDCGEQFLDAVESPKLDLSFAVFPNPTDGVIVLNSEKKITSVEIYNNLGRLVLVKEEVRTLDLSSLNEGVYFCKATDKNGAIGVTKIVRN